VLPLQEPWEHVPAGAGSRAAALPRSNSGPLWRGVAALLICAAAESVSAQLSGTLAAVTDYRYRGVTFSDRRPAAQAGLAYDDTSGWYAGAFGSTVRLYPPSGASSKWQTIAYAGYAVRLASGVSLEAGGDYAAFTGASDLNYGEVFVGAATENLNARVHYSPRYFGTSSDAIYGEINAAHPLIDALRLHVHVGFLRYRYVYPYGALYGIKPTKNILDGRIGLRADIDRFQLEVAWVGVSDHSAAYFVTGRTSPNGVVATLSISF
jgi:uncharacterized protein (TIGR02001 family)